MAYFVTGTNGNDVLDQSGNAGPGTIVGLAGDDCIFTGTGLATVTGDTGNDTVVLQTGNTGTINGGTENDSILADGGIGSMLLLGSAGADTIDTVASLAPQTIVGGQDFSDGADSIAACDSADLIFGNGGNDTIDPGDAGANTVIAGFGNDSIRESGRDRRQ